MKKVKELSLEEILDQIDLQIRIEDIDKFCRDQAVKQEIINILERKLNLDQVLIQNEEKIDTEKLLLITWIRSKEKIADLENKLLKKNETKTTRERLRKELRENQKYLRVIKEQMKGLDTYIVTAVSAKGIINKIKVVSLRETVYNANFKDREKENTRIFNAIDSEEESNMGISYIIQCLETRDFLEVLPLDIANAVIYRINNNVAKLSQREIEILKQKEANNQIDDEESMDLQRSIRENALIPESRKCIKELLKYIDLKKLLLLSIYRFEDILETAAKEGHQLPKQEILLIKVLAKQVLPYIGKDTKVYNEEVEYSYEDVKNLINRIDEEKEEYVSKQTLSNLKEELLKGGNIEDMDSGNASALFMIPLTVEEIEEIMKVSKANFAFGIIKLELSESQIIERAKESRDKWSEELTKCLVEEKKISISSALELLYEGLISAEFFKEFSEEISFSSEINLQKINEQYILVKTQQDSSEEDTQKLQGMIELYKILNLEEKSEEELQEASDNLMYELAEDFEEKEDVLFYYQEGLITLNTVAEWGGNSLIERLYNESKITFQDLEKLYNNKKINQQLIEQIVLENQDIDYTELMRCIYSGYISENKIIDFYM